MRERIIPAHAGNSRESGATGRPRSDHPRACGELTTRRNNRLSVPGSSPRMRGTRLLGEQRVDHDRIIPAHAGNSAPSTSRPSRHADHPRACGELGSRSPGPRFSVGSSPRMRGTLNPEDPDSYLSRIIPAHAGNSLPSRLHEGVGSDHPRACGELPFGLTSVSGTTGSSPRMRGTPALS